MDCLFVGAGAIAAELDAGPLTLGVCNVSREQLQTILDAGSVRPALVQIERHPYQPRTEMAEIADANGLTPAGVVLAWNVVRGVVPIIM